MNYNKDSKIIDILFDPNNKSRVKAIIYILLFIILVVFVRLNGNSNSTNKKNNQKKPEETEITDNTDQIDQDDLSSSEMIHNKDDEDDDDSLYNRFSLLRTDNYSFKFVVDAGTILTIDGERYDDNYKMKLSNNANSEVLECYAEDGDFMVKTDDKYETADFPNVGIDFFDNINLYNILYSSELKSEKNNEVLMTISAKRLYKYIMADFQEYIDNESSNNSEIKIILNNNKIKEMQFDLTGILTKDSEYKKLIIKLKYDKFNEIDEFTVDF